jgi:hypothetical protein
MLSSNVIFVVGIVLAQLGFVVCCIFWATLFRAASRTARLAPAAIIIERAVHASQVTRKPVFGLFDASWSPSCKRFEALISHPNFCKVLEANYVFVKLRVLERIDARGHIEHPGTEELLMKWSGLNAGLPYYVILNDNGRVIADSRAMSNGMNIGCPGTPEEIAAFECLLKRSAPKLSQEQREKFIEFLKINASNN